MMTNERPADLASAWSVCRVLAGERHHHWRRLRENPLRPAGVPVLVPSDIDDVGGTVLRKRRERRCERHVNRDGAERCDLSQARRQAELAKLPSPACTRLHGAQHRTPSW